MIQNSLLDVAAAEGPKFLLSTSPVVVRAKEEQVNWIP